MTRPILIVDDDEAVLEFIRLALGDEGYTVKTAPNGKVALDLAATDEPSLILLDMMMPVMDGWAFLDAYCKQGQKAVPVIAFSANAKNAPQVGCICAFLAKPFDLNKLIDLVKQCAL